MPLPDRNETWFPELSPPPGGLARLRHRIADDERRRARRFWRYAAVAPPVAAACAVLVLLLLPREEHPPAPRLDGVVAARLGLVPVPDGVEVVRDEGARFTAVPLSSSARVDIVWIGAGALNDEPPPLE